MDMADIVHQCERQGTAVNGDIILLSFFKDIRYSVFQKEGFSELVDPVIVGRTAAHHDTALVTFPAELFQLSGKITPFLFIDFVDVHQAILL